MKPDGEYWVFLEVNEGSYGGRPASDGPDSIDSLMANTRNNPLEDLAVHLPMLCDRYELRDDVMPGAGRFRGGLGVVKKQRILTDGFITHECDRHEDVPWGIFGGGEGQCGALQIYNAARPDDITDMPAKFAGLRVSSGDVMAFYGPCGGGYGDPLERPADTVLEDVLDDFCAASVRAVDRGSAAGEALRCTIDDGCQQGLPWQLTSSRSLINSAAVRVRQPRFLRAHALAYITEREDRSMNNISAALRIVVLSCLVASAGMFGAAFAADKVVGKFGHTGATASDYGQTILEFADRVNARAPGLEIQVFGDASLGGTQTLIEGVQLGNVHLANAGYGSLGAFVSELGAMELPFIFGRELDIDQIRKVTDSDLYEEWQNMLSEKIGARVVAPAWYYGHRDILVKNPANKPADLKGVKVRVVPAPLYVEIMKGLGAVPTPVDWPEVYNALKQGLIDGVDAATDSIEYMKFYEGATHYLGTHHITGLNAMIANQKWYSGLSDEDRQVLDEELVWFQKQFASRLQGIKPGVLEELEKQGVTMHEIDLAAFQQAIQDANVAQKVAEAGSWRSDTLDRFRAVLESAGYQPNF